MTDLITLFEAAALQVRAVVIPAIVHAVLGAGRHPLLLSFFLL